MVKEKSHNTVKIDTDYSYDYSKDNFTYSSPNMLGDTVTLKNKTIYSDEYSAYLGNNEQTAYYNADDERVVVGEAFWNKDTGMDVVYAYDENANNEIYNIINNGGELVAVVTEMREYLPYYNGSYKLPKTNYKPEGWHNINDVVIENELHRGGRI